MNQPLAAFRNFAKDVKPFLVAGERCTIGAMDILPVQKVFVKETALVQCSRIDCAQVSVNGVLVHPGPLSHELPRFFVAVCVVESDVARRPVFGGQISELEGHGEEVVGGGSGLEA